MVFFAGTFGLNFQMTSALMATQVFDKGAGEYGLLGTVHGGRLADRRADRRPAGAGPAAAGRRRRAGFGAVEIVAGLMPSYLAFALLVPAARLQRADHDHLRQRHDAARTPTPAMRGRVMALYMMIFMGGTPLGSPLIGWIGEHVRRPLDAARRRRPDDPRRAGRGAVFLRHERPPAGVAASPRFDPRLGDRVISFLVSGTTRPLRVLRISPRSAPPVSRRAHHHRHRHRAASSCPASRRVLRENKKGNHPVPTIQPAGPQGPPGQGVEEQDACPQGFAPATRRLHPRLHHHPEEAELRPPQGRPRAPVAAASRSRRTSRAWATTSRSTRSCSSAAAG